VTITSLPNLAENLDRNASNAPCPYPESLDAMLKKKTLHPHTGVFVYLFVIIYLVLISF